MAIDLKFDMLGIITTDYIPREGWAVLYKPISDGERTCVCVEKFEGSCSVEPHQHDYDEFVLIIKGSCRHKYKGRELTLIPGDVFIVPPHMPHSYTIDSDVTIFNCQFYAALFDDRWKSMLQSIGSPGSMSYEPIYHGELNKHGIIHLNPSETLITEGMLNDMIREQHEKRLGYEYVKQAYFDIVIVLLERIRAKQFESLYKYSDRKRELVASAIEYIEENMKSPLNFGDLAKTNYLSENYFRTIFKDVTGLSPVDYLNRIRIVKSLDYLKSSDRSIVDAAAGVGILDANYFSRLFKKIMGYSPRHFKTAYSRSLYITHK